MHRPEPHRPIDLAELEAKSPSVERLAAALRRDGPASWTSPFAASGGKGPPIAPAKPRR
jgi:hypothetical protein